MNIGSDGRTDVVSTRPLARHKWTEYEITAITYVFRCKDKRDSQSFVTAVKVKEAIGDQKWHFFNDLVITPTTQVNSLSKLLCRRSERNRISHVVFTPRYHIILIKSTAKRFALE